MSKAIDISYVNHVIKNLNDSSTELYESMADGDLQESLSCLDRMEDIIKEIKDEIKAG